LSLLRFVLALVAAALLAASPAAAAGFQYGTAPNPDDQPIELGIWYPSDVPTKTQPLGLFTQDVAYHGPIVGNSLPLVVISHGTGGSAAGHYDTALVLADAGFVVVALSHTGDNYKDRSYSFTMHNFVDRPKQSAGSSTSCLTPGMGTIISIRRGSASSVIRRAAQPRCS
jgi:predicted dienelactone hydrolase